MNIVTEGDGLFGKRLTVLHGYFHKTVRRVFLEPDPLRRSAACHGLSDGRKRQSRLRTGNDTDVSDSCLPPGAFSRSSITEMVMPRVICLLAEVCQHGCETEFEAYRKSHRRA